MLNYQVLEELVKKAGGVSAFAKKTNLDKSTISRMINRQATKIQIKTICKIVGAFDEITFEDLLIQIKPT